jgi:nucleoside-diphosphate-sugar epimerase
MSGASEKGMGHAVVFGANGKIGSALCAHLHDAIKIDLPEHDLRVFGDWQKHLVGAEVVYCCAGCADPQATFTTHAESTAIATNAIFASLQAGVKRIFFASSSWAARCFPDGRPETENTRAYGAAKRQVEFLAIEYPQVKMIRVGWYTGTPECPPGDEWKTRLWWDTPRLLRAFGIEM